MTTISVRFKKAVYVMPERDSQRKRVYTAERLALASRAQRTYPTVANLKKRVREIMGSKCVADLRREFGLLTTKKVDVKDGRGRRRPASFNGLIKMPKWSRVDWVLMHELAHEIAPAQVHHHWPFAYAYVKLVSRFMGVEAAKALKQQFRAHKVRMAPKRKRPQWQLIAELSSDPRTMLQPTQTI